MDRFARIVLGYHGAKGGEAATYAKQLLLGEVTIEEWNPSENEYDWLGSGIYFWEHSPERAKRWAGPDGIVISAVVQLGKCLDLTDVHHTEVLKLSHNLLESEYNQRGETLPKNKGRDLKLRLLDCLVINSIPPHIAGNIETVRGAFEEGEEAFPGSALRKETHIQISVRDRRRILGVFRPTFLD